MIISSSAITFQPLDTPPPPPLYGNTLIDYIITPKHCSQWQRLLSQWREYEWKLPLYFFFSRVFPFTINWAASFCFFWRAFALRCHTQKNGTERNWCRPWRRINILTAIQKCWMHTNAVSSIVLNAIASSEVLMAVLYRWCVPVAKCMWDGKV